MTGEPATGAESLLALLAARDRFSRLSAKDYADAAGLLVRKLMISAGQTAEDMTILRATVGEEIFEKQLKSLTAHQARLLARRLDPDVSDFDVSTAGAACQHVRKVMADQAMDVTPAQPEAAPDPLAEPAPETGTPEETVSEEPAEKPANAYFGRKSFRMD